MWNSSMIYNGVEQLDDDLFYHDCSVLAKVFIINWILGMIEVADKW